tara:strand:- start:226 stop:420 length:195 start_codon:yes stop_codon:yes gene_type:complete
MKKETLGEVVGHPLWMLPMMMFSLFVMIEGLHTTAHLRGEIDVHGLCRNNKEYIEMKEQDEDDW